MASKPDPRKGPQLAERQVLRALCSRHSSREQIINAIEQLANYDWLVPEHATVFQAIRRVAAVAGDLWRENLPAQATRMGFPDVEWSQYFALDGDEAPSLKRLISQLLRGGVPKRT
jgi:hypothetical protein